MGALTQPPKGALAMSLPALSDDLKSWLLRDPGNTEYLPPTATVAGQHVFRYRTPLSASLVKEASATAPAYARACQGPSQARIAAWLGPIALTVRNPLAADEIEGMAVMFAALLVDIPAACFTASTQLQASHTFKLWPSPADIVDLLAEDATEMRRAAAILAYIASAGMAS